GKYDMGTEPGMDTGGMGSGGTMEQARERAGEMAGHAREQVSEMADQARDRAEEMMGQARNRVSGMLEQAEDSEPVRMMRDNPLPALGIAFALGFLLAGSSDSGGRFGKAKQQVKGAVMGGISAALAQELRNLAGMEGGAGGLLDSIMGRGGAQGTQGARPGM